MSSTRTRFALVFWGWTQNKATDGTIDPDARRLEDSPEDQQKRAAIFDFIMGNTDRHNANYMILQNDSSFGPEKSLVLIDNGLLFPEELGGFGDTFRSNPFRKATGQYTNETVEDDFKKVWRDMSVDQLKELMEDRGFADEAMDGVFSRIERFLLEVDTYEDMETIARDDYNMY